MSVLDPVLVLDGATLRFAIDDFAGGVATAASLEVADADAASLWLPALVDEREAITLLESGGGSITVPPAFGALAWTLWARRWWPTSIRDGLPALDDVRLAIEAAVWTSRVERVAEGALDGFEADVPELLGHALVAVEHAVHDVDAAVLAMLDELDDEHAAQVERVRTALLERTPRSAVALAAGGERRVVEAAIASGESSVDWALVPPGALDAAERTVRWMLLATSPARLRVDVALAAGGADLTAWVGGIPVELVDRGVRATGEAEVAQADVDAIVAAGDDVEVRVASSLLLGTPPPTTREDRERARALIRARQRIDDVTLAERALRDDEF